MNVLSIAANSTDTNPQKISANVISNCHQLQITGVFLTPAVAFDRALPENVANWWVEAYQDCKIALSYSAPKANQAVTLVDSMSLTDFLEIWASINGNEITFTRLSAGTGGTGGTQPYNTYQFNAVADISSDGTVQFGRDNMLTVKITGLRPDAVSGTTVVGSASLSIETLLHPTYSNRLAVLRPLTSMPEAVTPFDVAGRRALFLADDCESLHLYAYSGIDFEVTSDILPNYIDLNMPSHILADGLRAQYHTWFAYPLAGFAKGTYKMSSTTTVYMLDGELI